MVNNRNYSRQTAKKLQRQRAVLYTPQTESDWGYSHHATMAEFKGKLYAMWSSGRTHEDLFGQKVMYACTENGTDWSEPAVLVDTIMGDHSEAVLQSGGFHVYDGVLYAYITYFEYEIESMLPRGYIAAMRGDTFEDWFPMLAENTVHRYDILVLSTEDGQHWSKPRSLDIPGHANHPPFRTASGRLILPGGVMFPYTDDPTGQSGWVKNGLIPRMEVDDWFLQEELEKLGYHTSLSEASGYVTDDGVIHMLMRSDYYVSNDCYLYETRSCDNGHTWSAPERTDFTNDHTKFYASRLPDGRFYIISSPEVHNGRCPLVISLSDDGENFNRYYVIEDEESRIPLKFPGMNKHKPIGYCFSYPHAVVWNGKMYVITGANKETILVSSFDLAQLK